MADLAGSLGKLTGKTLSGFKSVSRKTVEVAKTAPKKTTTTLSDKKDEFIAGFRSEVPASANPKIGEVESEISSEPSIINNTITQ
jgi:hypothetical protein